MKKFLKALAWLLVGVQALALVAVVAAIALSLPVI